MRVRGMMFQQVCADEADAADEDELHPALYVVRSPEIVWLADDEPAVVAGDVAAIAGGFARINAALARCAFDEATDISRQMLSLSQAAGATELGENIQRLAVALQSTPGLSSACMADLHGLLVLARASLVDARESARRAP